MNENKEKIIKQVKPKLSSNGSKTATNPLSKTVNSLNKPTFKNIQPAKEAEKFPPKKEKIITDPIAQNKANIVARINNFNTNKTSNRMYAGYMTNAASSYKVVDYVDFVYNLNSTLNEITTVHELFASVHELFTERLRSVFTAFGIVHEQSKCINIKLFNSLGSTYSTKLVLSDENNPIIQCFKENRIIVEDNNKFLNIPYLRESSAYIFPLNSISGCKGVMVVGKDSLENHIGLFSFIANYCALFMQNV